MDTVRRSNNYLCVQYPVAAFHKDCDIEIYLLYFCFVCLSLSPMMEDTYFLFTKQLPNSHNPLGSLKAFPQICYPRA